MMFNFVKSAEDHVRQVHTEHEGDITDAYSINNDILHSEIETIGMLDDEDMDSSPGEVNVDDDQFKDAVEKSLSNYMKGFLEKGAVSPDDDRMKDDILIDIGTNGQKDEDCLNALVEDIDRAIVSKELEGFEGF